MSQTLESRTTEIAAWLVARLARTLEVEATRISVEENLTSYALDSAEIVELLGELEDWLGCDVPASVLWDRPTIAAIAESIASTTGRSGP